MFCKDKFYLGSWMQWKRNENSSYCISSDFTLLESGLPVKIQLAGELKFEGKGISNYYYYSFPMETEDSIFFTERINEISQNLNRPLRVFGCNEVKLLLRSPIKKKNKYGTYDLIFGRIDKRMDFWQTSLILEKEGRYRSYPSVQDLK